VRGGQDAGNIASYRPTRCLRRRFDFARYDSKLEARLAHTELEVDRFDFLLGYDASEPWASYVRKLDDNRRGIDLPGDWVPSTFVGALLGRELVGRASVRHQLNDFLLNMGGHIGYAVRPHYRRQGFGTELLRQALIVARADGVDRVLVTCDEDNIASAKIIESHGRVLEDTRTDPNGPPRRRYWID
jgi:predicted acetyltransferase